MRPQENKKITMNLNQQIEAWLQARIANFQSELRPFITLSYAQSWDGSIASRSGETLNFSCDESMRLTHQLRSLHDGILVGVGTVLCDDPQLTVREWSGKNPQPIVLDSRLRTPVTAKICHHPDKQCWILSVENATHSLGEKVDVITVGSDTLQDQVPLSAAMKMLAERNIKSLMVEGGAAVITAFLQARLVDALILTVAPKLVGGYKAVGDLQASDGDDRLNIHPLHSAHLGDDMVVWGELQYGGSAA